MKTLLFAAAICLLGGSGLGCAADDPGPPRIEASVAYAGAARGPLVIAAFPSRPPMGRPSAFVQNAAPSFPATVVLDTLEPGATLYVLAMLDVAPASPQQPGPEDRIAWSDALTIAAEGPTPVQFELVDP
jgi:hypothetical protein